MKWKVGVYPYIFHISLFVFLIAQYMLDNLIENRATLEEVDWRAGKRKSALEEVDWRATGSKIGGRRGRKLEGDGVEN